MRRLAVAAVAALAFAGCGGSSSSSGGKPELTVSAASSLRDAFTEYSKSDKTATVRLSFRPTGSVADTQGRLLHPLTVEVETTGGPIEKQFTQGQLMRPENVTLALTDGFVANYPFDNYHTALDVVITRADRGETVPTVLDVFAAVHGFSFTLAQEGSDKDGGHFVQMTVSRAPATRFFSIFLIVMMWALTIGVLGLLVRVVLLGRYIQFPMFAFLGALLFAFPAVRNAQPNAPPIGVRSDYLSFFWCETLVALTLITLLGVWILRQRYDS